MKDHIVLLLFFVRLCKACEFDFWVFDTYQDPPPTVPSDSATLIADGECRSIGSGGNPNFPGYYRATCSGDNIQFSVSGCDSSCQQCGLDPYDPGALYTFYPVPISPAPSRENNFRTHIRSVTNNLVSVNFAAYGTCSRCPSPTTSPVTSHPTITPSRSPISFQPIKAPTNYPTTEPTRRPTDTPSMAPVSSRPTRSPTNSPTNHPTPRPSLRPVVAPVSPSPTRTPTKKPTRFPSTQPTDAPVSSVPVLSPISTRPPLFIPLTISVGRPTSSPTERPGTPSEFPIRATANPLSTPVESLALVSSRVTGSQDGVSAEAPEIAPGETFGPQTGTQDSASTETPEKVSDEPFGKPEAGPQDGVSTEVPEIASGEAFVKPKTGSTPTSNSVQEMSKSRSVHIIGYSLAVLGGLAMISAVFAVVVLHRKRRADGKVDKDSEGGDKATNPSTVCSKERFILVDECTRDEMSTLGGYTGLVTQHQKHGGGSLWEDPTVSVDVGYDFERNAYKSSGQNSQTAGSISAELSNDITLHPFGDILFNDETSFEQQFFESGVVQRRTNETFEIVVPPGVVGIVVDSAIGGLPPVVRSLGVNSVLKEKVKVGDRLLSVADEESTHDVTNMSARAVSAVISQAASQKRTLRFATSDADC